PWVIVGFGAGLIAAVLSRSLRKLEEEQAPYLAAHRLMTQLRQLSQELTSGLDSESSGAALLRDVMVSGTARRAMIFTESPGGELIHLASNEPSVLPTPADFAAAESVHTDPGIRSGLRRFPITVGDHRVGVLLAEAEPDTEGQMEEAIEQALSVHSIPLDTALLFDDVRAIATAEERQRLARDIHDGVAQDVASLGYVIDDLAASSTDPQVQTSAALLRAEVSRVVSELRHSIFDLRSAPSDGRTLGQTLMAYVEGAAERSDLLPHLRVEETGSPLAPRTQAEILWIAQEAMANVRKHAVGAENVWLEFSSDGSNFRLTIRDDGQSGEVPQVRPGHYGLHTMRERAARINASLRLQASEEGGTALLVQCPDQTEPSQEEPLT
ncbi:MAG: histidine kinase, partial [Nocardioides sp.]